MSAGASEAAGVVGRSIIVAPSTLSADFGRLAEEVCAVDAAGADWIHVDVMDGRFVPNITLGPVVVEALRRSTAKPLNVHLMIVEPQRYIADFARAGADHLLVHAEALATVHLHAVLSQIRDLGKKAGVVLDPASPVELIEYVLHLCDVVLVMTVNPGFSDQRFLPEMLPKIRRLRALCDSRGLSPVIEVDGGVNGESAGAAIARAPRRSSPAAPSSGRPTMPRLSPPSAWPAGADRTRRPRHEVREPDTRPQCRILQPEVRLVSARGGRGPVLRGEVQDMMTAPRLVARGPEGGVLVDRRWPSGTAPGFVELLEAVLDVVERQSGPRALAAVGHRVVHGGAKHVAPARVTPALLADLEALTSLDPLHMPHCLAPMRAIASAHPGLPQVACFDTAFHGTMPAVATRIALPRALAEAGLRRYGFHGLSYDYVARKLGQLSPTTAQGRVIVAHLGSGASLCALLSGRSIATTMGFSVLDGLVMATRCGSLDPGVILYLGRQGHSWADIETLLYEQSGLLGVSGVSGDMQALLASGDPQAREAIDLFTYRVATETGALLSALGGLDGLVFTAGIAEHAPAIRAEICGRLAWLGLRLDEAANAASLPCISTPDSRIEVRVIATDEDAMIARHTRTTLGRRP